eukprot:TRINITY_DN417_c0_g1_i1.p1 TRINITY_DN417_c0_g1~~TRINITY_DN417_c0_g1_i1.p1  ORF type:complete len:168 (-),score=22.30 TRINITY_DN417_c0_g1_i1:643-1146(-)
MELVRKWQDHEVNGSGLSDSIYYMFSHARRIFSENFIPNNNDIVQATTRRTSLQEFCFIVFKMDIFKVFSSFISLLIFLNIKVWLSLNNTAEEIIDYIQDKIRDANGGHQPSFILKLQSNTTLTRCRVSQSHFETFVHTSTTLLFFETSTIMSFYLTEHCLFSAMLS